MIALERRYHLLEFGRGGSSLCAREVAEATGLAKRPHLWLT